MSVINQMLRNLDERRASERERAGLPSRLRSLPAGATRRGSPWPWLAAGVALGVLIAWLAVALWRPAPGSPVAGDVAPPPALSAQAGLSALPDAAAAVAEAPAAAAPPDPAPAAAVEGVAVDMRLSMLLAQTPPAGGGDAGVAAQERPPAPRAAAIPAPEAKVVPTKPVAPPSAAVAAASPGEEGSVAAQIDRRPRGDPARERADAEYRKGMQALRRGDNAGALASLRAALELDATLAAARQALLAALVAGSQWTEAQAVAAAGLALDPRQSGWAVVLARLQLERGEPGSAIDTLERHAAHAAGDADFQGLFAYVLHQARRFDEAAARYQAALAVRPGEGRWWFGLATALESAGKANAAREAYTRARATPNLPAEMATTAEQRLRQIPGP